MLHRYKMNKVAVIALFFICSITYIQGNNVINNGIYALIDTWLNDVYKENPNKAQCMSKELKRKNVADKFYTWDIILDQGKMQKDLQPYVDEANFQCSVIAFMMGPWGIGLLVLVASLIVIAFIRCIFRCICR